MILIMILFVLKIIINIILGGLFTMIYLVASSRSESTLFVFAYHLVMFSVILPHLKFLSKDLYVIILKCSNKINDVEIRDF